MKYISDKSGKILGRIMESDNNTQRAYDNSGRYLGVYNEKANTTLDKSGRIVTKGNSLSNLIFDYED
jgi:hypothetical protein